MPTQREPNEGSVTQVTFGGATLVYPSGSWNRYAQPGSLNHHALSARHQPRTCVHSGMLERNNQSLLFAVSSPAEHAKPRGTAYSSEMLSAQPDGARCVCLQSEIT